MADERDDLWYEPRAWEAEPSPIAGMNRGEFERIAERILWFETLTLEQKLWSFARHRAEQRWFEQLELLPDAR